MNTTITSSELNTLKLDTLDVIRNIRDTQAKLSRILEKAQKVGIDTKRRENESELECLGRVAEILCEHEHNTRLNEARSNVRATVAGHMADNGPRSFIGRSLNRLANIAG